jgi:hypothetical protein
MTRNHVDQNGTGPRPLGWRIVRMVVMIIGGIVLAALFALALGVVVQWLWNWLMPDVFGLTRITFWQAVGLLFLSKLLFGGLRHHHGGRHHQGRRMGRGHGRHWREYGRFWCEKGPEAADDILEQAAPGGSGPQR